MEKKLGSAFSVISRKKKSVSNEVYEKDVNRLKHYKNLESKQSVYLIFREVTVNNSPRTLYIGKTSQTIAKRFKNHLSHIKLMVSGKKEWESKYLWMAQVIDSGGKLVIMELNKVQTSDIYRYEQEWIKYLKDNDFNMLNKVNKKYYKHKILNL